MSYSLKHLQHTAHYIVNCCQYSSGESLTASAKRHLFDELVIALRELSYRDTAVMVIDSNNLALRELFTSLLEDNIIFPQDTTFLIKSTGESFEKRKKVKTKIYDCQEIKYHRDAAEKYRAIRDGAKPPSLNQSFGEENIFEHQPVTFLTAYEKRKAAKSASQQRSNARDWKLELNIGR